MPEDRRSFLTKAVLGTAGLALGLSGVGRMLFSRLGGVTAPNGQAVAAPATGAGLVWAEGKDPYATTVAAIDKLGGIKRFVSKGQRVALLPNIGWARTMEQGANTHPEVVRAVIDQCEQAGAKSITVFCNPCNDIRVCLEQSGIGAVVDQGPAKFEFINKQGWRERQTPAGCTFLKTIEVYRLVEDSDVLINIPVAKHHGGAQLTMCCKNLMGLVRDRGTIHQKLHEGIADLALSVPHALCVLDASRIMLRGGPTGGDLKDVAWKNTIIVGTDPMQVDVLGTTLFGLKPGDIGYLRMLGERGRVVTDPLKLSVQRITA